MYTIFCCGSRAKRASSSSQTSRAELVLWLGSLTSRAEPARFLNEPARARSSRAELARYPPLARTMRWVGTWGWVRVRPPIFPSHQPERCVQRPHVNPRLPKYILPLISSIYFYILDDRLNKIKIYIIHLKI
jgi:hypothetical protein